MRIFYISTLFVASTLCSAPLNLLASETIGNIEESLFLRRIVDFWEEGEYTIAKHQMGEFLETFSESSYANTLRMTLGDLFLREKNFQEAINCYSQISDPILANQLFIRRMQCLYHLQWHATLADECEAYLQQTDDQKNNGERLEATYLLATALYEQCIHHTVSEEELVAIAERAKPYFEILSNSRLSNEVAGAFAHLRCILKDFQGASQIYLNLANETANPEEFLFQAALLESKYDKRKSLQSFGEIAEEGGKFAAEAAYNRLLISFDLGLHEEIIADGAQILIIVPPEKKTFVQVILGQSYLALNKCTEAAAAFNAFLQEDIPTESIQPVLLQIVETAYRTANLALLDLGIEKWTALDPKDPNLATASFTRAQILKKEGKLEEAKKEIATLLKRFPEFEIRPEAAFNLIQLEASGTRLAAYREAALFFIQQYPSHELTPSAWKHLAFASSKLATESKELTEQFIRDLETYLTKCVFCNPAEKFDLQFRLAKSYFDIGAHQESLNLLELLCESDCESFETKADAELLLALCFRDGQKDLSRFCELAELALLHKATLLSQADQHLALFNAYLHVCPEAKDILAQHL
ncbi:MAG TPA: tetratricopeptide repeat protein, partial [Chlamydiales bacterium]|nr:tetratricopeptide repeat protein [Chlamydiales bacterium]